MQLAFFQKHPVLKDILSLASFVIAIVAGTLFLNTYIYRSYNVVGASMENTLHNDDVKSSLHTDNVKYVLHLII